MAAPSQREYDWQVGDVGLRMPPLDMLGGQPAHTAEPIEYLAQQISSTAEATYTDINRKGEFAFAQDDLSEGMATKDRFGVDVQKKFRYSKGVDTTRPNMLLPTSKVTAIGTTIAEQPTCWVQRGSITYVAAGTKLYQLATSASNPALDTTFGASITSLFVWGGYLLVGLGETADYQYRAGDVSASAFTTATGVKARYWGASGDLLYKATRPKTVSIADAVGGPWADYDCGDSSYNVTSLGFLDQVAIVGKEDGPYVFDMDFVAQPLVPELKLQADATVCAAAGTFNRDYYVSTRLGAIRIRSGEGLKSIGLDTLIDPAAPSGITTIDAFCSDGRYLYAIVAPTGTAGLYIWKHDYNGNWHNFQYRSDLGQAAKMIEAVSKIGSTAINAIVFAYQSGGNWQLAYAQFPATLDPTKDSAYTFETANTGYVRTLDYSAAYPTVPKFATRLKSVQDNATTARQITYSAWLDNETTSRAIATFQKSPWDTVDVTLPQFHRCSLEIGLTSEATQPPKLKAFHFTTDLLPPVIRMHKVTFVAKSLIALATGGRTRGDWQTILDDLRELRASRKLVPCRDENLREFDAYVEDITEVPAVQSVQRGEPVMMLQATIKEVASV